jgi:hypothetical protein
MPMEQAHIMREEEDECEEEEDGTLITMDTTLGLDEPVSNFFLIILRTIYNCLYVCIYV